MKVEMIAHESGDLLPLILDKDGLPIPAPNEFIISRRYLSPNTLTRNARELSILYSWLAKCGIDLDSRIQGKYIFSEAEIKGSLVELLRRDQSKNRKIKKAAVGAESVNQRLLTIRQYIIWYGGVAAGMVPNTSLDYEKISNNKDNFLLLLDSSFISSPPTNRKEKSLNSRDLQSLLSLLNSEDHSVFGQNEAVSNRNYIIIMILLYYGLRPGELLSLRVEDIEIGAISAIRVVRRSPDLNDTRRPRPQIKRNGRVLPIDDYIFIKKLDLYITKWRDVLSSNAKSDSDYLILSDEGQPLSQPSITQFFQLFRNKHSHLLPSHLSAKALAYKFFVDQHACIVCR